MCEAVRVHTRYNTKGEDGETRRDRNERVGEDSPSLFIPEEGNHLWEWFWQLNDNIYRVSEGFYHLIPPSEILAWCKITETFIHHVEYDILTAMDLEYCNEVNLELQANRSKREEEQKRQVNESRRRK